MGLIKCPDCEKLFSDRIDACPNCGCPKTAAIAEIAKEQMSTESQPTIDETPVVTFVLPEELTVQKRENTPITPPPSDVYLQGLQRMQEEQALKEKEKAHQVSTNNTPHQQHKNQGKHPKSLRKPKSRHVGAIIVLFVIMYAVTFGGLVEDLLQMDMSYTVSTTSASVVTIIAICITSIIMMIVPFICRMVKKERLPYKSGKRLCLWNSIVLFIISSLLNIIGLGFVGWLSAIMFYFINKWIFVKDKNDPLT